MRVRVVVGGGRGDGCPDVIKVEAKEDEVRGGSMDG